MVPVQTRVTQVRLAVQKGRRALHSVTEVVVVITERDCMLINYISEHKKKKTYIFYYNGTVYSTFMLLFSRMYDFAVLQYTMINGELYT